jgi:general secretion pathway protein J
MKRAGASRGFTLVEILVVLTLMSVIMLALGSAMRTIAQTEARVDARMQRTDEMRVATSFISGTLGRVSARRAQATTQAGASPFQFSGAADAITWVGVMPARYGAGGRSFFRLGLERQGDRSDLVIRFVPWAGQAAFPDWSLGGSRLLVRDVARATFEYASEDDPSAWQPEWTPVDRLPGRVRMSLRTAAVEWPQLTIALRQLTATDSVRGGFTVGPE